MFFPGGMAEAGSDKASWTSLVHYEDSTSYLRDVAINHRVPTFIKIIKGQYRTLGASKSTYSEAYLHSVRTIKKACGMAIKVRDRKKVAMLDQSFSIPLTYQGWFEVLNEGGKAVKPLTSVSELTKAFPAQCLVRENCKCYTARENGEINMEKTRILEAGEVLNLEGEFTVRGFSKKRFLRCRDLNGRNVYLSRDLKAAFNPIAGHGNISGVHTIKGLITKFQLPISVRLVHGTIPSRIDKTSFTGAFRLTQLYSDETAFITPPGRDAKMVPVSTREPLKVVISTNFESVKDIDECKVLQGRTTRMIESYLNSIHILVKMPETGVIQQVHPRVREPNVQQNNLPRGELDIIYNEIDDIYQYVRRGGEPPPPHPRPHPPASRISTATHKSEKSAIRKFFGGGREDRAKMAADRHHLQERGEYWEEPIYKEIDNTQRHSMHVDHIQSSAERIMRGSSERLYSRHSPSHHINTKDSNMEMEAPPVPPKKYHDDIDDSMKSVEDLRQRPRTSGSGSHRSNSPKTASVFVPKEVREASVSGSVSAVGLTKEKHREGLPLNSYIQVTPQDPNMVQSSVVFSPSKPNSTFASQGSHSGSKRYLAMDKMQSAPSLYPGSPAHSADQMTHSAHNLQYPPSPAYGQSGRGAPHIATARVGAPTSMTKHHAHTDYTDKRHLPRYS